MCNIFLGNLNPSAFPKTRFMFFEKYLIISIRCISITNDFKLMNSQKLLQGRYWMQLFTIFSRPSSPLAIDQCVSI